MLLYLRAEGNYNLVYTCLFSRKSCLVLFSAGNLNYARYELSYINFMEKLPNETYNEAFKNFQC